MGTKRTEIDEQKLPLIVETTGAYEINEDEGEQFSDEEVTSDPKIRTLEDIYAKCNIAVLEPRTVEQAIKNEVWWKAMQDEINMIHKNETWEIVAQ